MGTLPTLKPREVAALLRGLGFAEIPFHSGRDISPTLLRKIAKDIGLTADQLLKGDQGTT